MRRVYRKTTLALLAALAGVGLLPATAFAAGLSQAAGESNLPYLYGVYTVTWVAFFAYAFYMSRRQRELRREVEELRAQLQERSGRG